MGDVKEAVRRIDYAKEDDQKILSLKGLDLTDNEIPDSIGQISGLTELDISSNKFTVLPEVICNLTQLTKLNLSLNQLKTLPDSIAKLIQLTELRIFGHQLATLPDSIAQLTKLRELCINGKTLTTLPASIGQLTELTRFNLTGTKLIALPDSIGQLTRLTKLDLNSNQLTTIPDTIGQLAQLIQLELRGNQLTTIPESIGELDQLVVLKLSNNMLVRLPESIEKLAQLTTLILRRNQLNMVPNNIGQLNQLVELDLSYNQLSQIPEGISQLTELRQLDLSDNQLAIFPDSISSLIQLHELHIRNNPFTTLPASAANLVPRIQFGLEIDKVNTLPDDALAKLKQYNEQVIKDIIKNIKEQNPLSTDEEIAEYVKELIHPTHYGEDIDEQEKRSNESFGNIRPQYDWRLEQKGKVIRRILKIAIVGNPGTGKTTLFNQICKHFDPNFEVLPTGKDDRTYGLNVSQQYNYVYQNQTYSVNIWDFGGQRIQYMIHHYLLSSNTFFILMIDAENVEDNTDYWMQIINQLAKNSPISVIYNKKVDDIEPKYDVGPYRSCHDSEIKTIPSNIKNNNSFLYLLDILKNRIAGFRYCSIPKKWEVIEKVLKNSNIPYMDRKKVISECEKHGLDDPNKQQKFLVYLHRIGSILYYYDKGNDDNDDLYDLNDINNWIFLKPKWVTDAIYHIFKHRKIEENQGVFTRKDLYEMWRQKYSGRDINLLEKLMLHRYFEICYPWDDHHTKFVIPSWLPIKAPQFKLPEIYHMRYNYQYALLPIGFISHLIIRFQASSLVHLKKNTDGKLLVWRTGLILEYKDCTAQFTKLVRNKALNNDQKQNTLIQVTYRGNRNCLDLLREIVSAEFDKLHKQFSIYITQDAKEYNVNNSYLSSLQSYDYSCLQNYHIVRLGATDTTNLDYASISVECPHCAANKFPTTRYFYLHTLINETKDNGVISYNSNFTCPKCNTEISPEAVLTGRPVTVGKPPLKVPTIYKKRETLATRICTREFLLRRMKEDPKKFPTKSNIADTVDVNSAVLTRMAWTPMTNNEGYPGKYNLGKVITHLEKNATSFNASYSEVIEKLVNDAELFQKLLNADSEDNREIFNTIFNEIKI